MKPDPSLLEHLDRTWSDPPGFWGFLTTVDHKRIAARYIVTALLLMFLAGMLALDMRWQLSVPENTRMTPQLFNESFSLHGSTMLFLVSVPLMEAMAFWLVPLMLGARNMAFPRLGAFSFWLYFGGVLTLWVAHAIDITPDLGWFEYPPLSGPAYSPGHRADIWAQMITFTEVAALAASVNVAATILKMRPPGMTLARMPVFLWAMLIASIMTIFSMPAVMLVTSMLIADRLVSTHFFSVAAGGDAVLFQHLFWFFGHPEVYIIFVPATGFVSSIVETFSRRPLYGHSVLVLAILSIGALAFGLWVHHMFAVGLPRLGNDFYTAASMAIAVPAGLQIFCWIATIGTGRTWFPTPMLWIIGFVATFVIGGLSGVMTASAALDLQLTDTYFIVAHLHYVLIGGAIFPLFGAFCYWYPKATGRLMSERWGKVAFVLIVGGFNLGFFPMHLLGLEGMPRRVYTYPADMGWETLNQIATAGSAIAVTGGLVFVANALCSYWRGRPAGADPWGGSTLEWGDCFAASCLQHRFHAPRREPHADVERRGSSEGLGRHGNRQTRSARLFGNGRAATLSTEERCALDLAARGGARRFGHVHRQHLHTLGDPDRRASHRSGVDRMVLAEPPTRENRTAGDYAMSGPREFETVGTLSNLPASASGPRHLVWWGNIGFMVIEGTGFLLAAAVYLYLMTQASVWPPAGDQLPGLLWSGIFTAGLLLSEIPNLWVLRCARAKDLAGVRWGTLAMAVIALLLFVPRGFEFAHLGVPWHQDAYGSAIWLLLVLHTVHVVTDWADTAVLGAWLFTHEVGDDQFADVEDNSNYWTFVVLCWLPVYLLVYWLPRAS